MAEIDIGLYFRRRTGWLGGALRSPVFLYVFFFFSRLFRNDLHMFKKLVYVLASYNCTYWFMIFVRINTDSLSMFNARRFNI